VSEVLLDFHLNQNTFSHSIGSRCACFKQKLTFLSENKISILMPFTYLVYAS